MSTKNVNTFRVPKKTYGQLMKVSQNAFSKKLLQEQNKKTNFLLYVQY